MTHSQGGADVLAPAIHASAPDLENLDGHHGADDEDNRVAQAIQAKLSAGDLTAMDDQHDDEPGGDLAGGFKFDTPEHKEQLRQQRQQLWAWLKHVGGNMFRDGINLTKISLPVCLFEARSFLERMTTNWDYLDFLVKASDSSDPVQRMKYVIAFAVAGLCRQVSFHKPFNPILGETYQSRYPNGVELYCEQISHHPPVSSWQMLEPSGKFVFYGSGNWTAGIKGNSVRGRQSGINCVQFADGSKITWELPGIIVKGVLWGQRSIKYGGEMQFKDEKNGLSCNVLVDPQPQQGWVSSWFRSKKAAGYKPDLVKGTIKRGSTALETCVGNWLYHLDWEKEGSSKGAVRMWDARRSAPLEPSGVEAPLASDCRHRQDLLHLKAGDQIKAQEWKLTLEVQQRNDRKLRKEGGGVDEH